MDATFWHNCWERNSLGFHQEDVHPFLEKYLAPQLSNAQSHVFVPLCGKSLDMFWLAEHMRVTGAELSEIACRDFFQEQQINYRVDDKGRFKVFSFEEISLYQGDFFQLKPEDINAVDWIYDRAALIALPYTLQQRYVDHLLSFLPPQATLCLISLEFPQDELQGPPFATFSEDIIKLFSGCTVNCIAENELEDKKFAQRTFNVSKLVERLYFINKR